MIVFQLLSVPLEASGRFAFLVYLFLLSPLIFFFLAYKQDLL